eukprot:symbB.v1.2.033201.t1/scaffold4094.1/size44825/1
MLKLCSRSVRLSLRSTAQPFEQGLKVKLPQCSEKGVVQTSAHLWYRHLQLERATL